MQAAATSEYRVSLPHVFSPCVDGATEAAALGLHACWGVADRAIGGFPPPGLVVMVASMLERSSGMQCALRLRAVDKDTTHRRPPGDEVRHRWRIERDSPDASSATIYTQPSGVEREVDPTATAAAAENDEEGGVRLPLVFGPEATDDDVFRRVGVAAVHEALFKGRSRAFVSYGVTGSGKHHTMCGLMLRSLAYVFEQRDSHRSLAGVRVKLEAVDLDRSELVDTLGGLESGLGASTVRVREHPPNRVVLLDGAKSVECTSLARVQREVLDVAQRNRAVRSTHMGPRSSGHTQIIIAHLIPESCEIRGDVSDRARLMFVVLAGAEFITHARRDSHRLPAMLFHKEVATLMRCCGAVRDCARFVPYRDSQLTHLLSPALRQGSLCMIFTARTESDTDEVETLRRAKRFELTCCGPPRPRLSDYKTQPSTQVAAVAAEVTSA